MKKGLLFTLLITSCLVINAQIKITMTKEGGVYTVPCKVNGLPLKFIFDTGASDVSISLTEAVFMLKNGYLKKEDIGESVYYSIANGDIAKGTKINIKEIEFGGLKLYNIEASIVHEASAPLLLGQSAISKLGKIQLEGNELIILTKGQNEYDYTSSKPKIESTNKNSSLIENPFSKNFTGTQSVYTKSPILDKPTMGENEKEIGLVEYNTVTILEKVNDKFYKVKAGNLVGYLWAGWIKKQIP